MHSKFLSCHIPSEPVGGMLKFCVILLFALIGSDVYSQSLRDSLLSEVESKLEPLIDFHLSKGLPKLQLTYSSNSFPVVDDLLGLYDQQLDKDATNLILNAKISEAKNDIGLDFRFQGYHFFNEEFLSGEEIDDQVYPSRVRFGLEWDILKSGFFARENIVDQLELQKKAARIEEALNENKDRFPYRYNLFIYYFNKEKIRLSQERLLSLQISYELLQKIYLLRDIFYEKIIETKSKLEQLEIQLHTYISYNKALEQSQLFQNLPVEIDIYTLPIFGIDLQKLLGDSSVMSAPYLELLEVNSMIADLRSSTVHDISLRLQLHQNLAISDVGLDNRAYSSAGLSAIVPVNLIWKNGTSTHLRNAEAIQEEKKMSYAHLNAVTEISNYYYEMYYKLKQYYEFAYKDLLYTEKLRLEFLNRDQFVNYYQPFDLLKVIDNLYLIRLEIIDLKQQIYLLLLKIYSKTNLKEVSNYLVSIKQEDFRKRMSGTRSIIINNNDILNYKPVFIKDYIHFTGFDKVIINANWDVPGVSELLSELYEIETIEIVEKIYVPDLEGLYEPVLSQKKSISHNIIFEITDDKFLADYFKVGGDPLKLLESFLIEFSSKNPSVKVYLEVPRGFPLSQINDLASNVDKLYFSKWDPIEVDSILNLMNDGKLPMGINAIPLDVSNVKDRLKLEAIVQEKYENGVSFELIFQDFDAFIKLETKTLLLN